MPTSRIKLPVKPTARQAELIRDFNVLYYHGLDNNHLWNTTQWLGVQILKCPMDLWVYQELITATAPEVIVECGVYAGGTTLYLANLFDLLGGTGQVLACDITLQLVPDKVRVHPRVRLFEGSSTDPALVAEIAARCRGKRTMVILDSDHARDHVLGELELYGPLVTPGCYLVCEDTNVNGHPVVPEHGPGPFEAAQEFVCANPGWEIDARCERLLVTYNPSGYLRRLAVPARAVTPATSDEPYPARLAKLLESAAQKDQTRTELFHDCDDDFWFWLHTAGQRQSPALREFLPGLPAEDMQSNLTGMVNDDTLTEAFGFYKLLKAQFARFKGPLHGGHRIIEFGCGWGRMLRFFIKDLEPDHLWGVDCYADALAATQNTPLWVTLRQVPPRPPTELPDESFDFVFAFSVFSHLSEDAHLQWLVELKRILKPGGLLLVTTCGRTFFEHCHNLRQYPSEDLPPFWDGFKAYFPDYEQAVADYEAGQYCYSPLPEPMGPLDGSFFGMTCIPKGYVERVWAEHFTVLDFLENQPFDQHVILALKPPAPTVAPTPDAEAAADEPWQVYEAAPGEVTSVERLVGNMEQVVEALEKTRASTRTEFVEPDDLPLPPPELNMYVSGLPNYDYNDFFMIGRLCADANDYHLWRNGADTERCQSILDFGCGCGRVIRHYQELTQSRPDGRVTKLYGTDYNPRQIAWCQENLPFAEFKTNGLYPPLDYADAQFDFIYAWSVFTHLSEDQQLAWMAEFARLLPPGGHLLISTNGEKYLKNREMPRSLVQRFRAGELVVLYPELNQSFETYGACDVYHPESWVRKHLTRHFACVDYAANDFGDYYLFRKD